MGVASVLFDVAMCDNVAVFLRLRRPSEAFPQPKLPVRPQLHRSSQGRDPRLYRQGVVPVSFFVLPARRDHHALSTQVGEEMVLSWFGF